MSRNRDFQYTINEKLPYCVPKCLNLASTSKSMILEAVFTKYCIRIAKRTGQIYIKMNQNCIFKHKIIAWLILLFAFSVS